MDATQVNSLIQAMAAMTAAMQRQQPQTQNVSVLSTFDAFDQKTESFKTYKERLEIHFKIKKVFENKELCAQLLLQYIGSTNYVLMTSLAAPKAINTLSYDELIALLEKYFCPKKNILVEQHKFFCEIQNEEQSIAQYVAQLRKRAADCAFKCSCNASVSDICLRAQFIRGIRNEYMREQLLQNSEENFDKIVDKALSLEAAKANNKIIAHSSSNSTEIHQVKHSHNQKSAKANNYRQNKKRAFKTKINYSQLGLEGVCLHCGRNNHTSNDCKVNKNKLKCDACNKTGHIKKVCIKNKLKSTHADSNCNTNTVEQYHEEIYQGINTIIDIYNKSSFPCEELNKFYVHVLIEGKSQKFEVDSGAGYTLLPEQDFKALKLNVPMQKSKVIFRTYTGDVFMPLGVVDVQVKYKNKHAVEQMYIVPANHAPLLGRIWIRHLNINLHEIDQLESAHVKTCKTSNIFSIEEIMHKFADIFEAKVGCIPNVCCSLKLQQGAKPVFVKERQVPFALREKVEKELDILEKEGIITKINTSNWGSPLVVIPKPDGNVRLCVDYKVGVNPQLEPSHYPIRRIDEILNQLNNAKYFCKLDLFKAYLHVMVDEESKAIQTISTHRGTYQVNRLSFGIKIAPGEFNRILDQILAGIEGALSYFDDIIVYGATIGECEMRLIKVFERLQQNQLHVNKAKCEFFKTKIQYLGHTISYNKITKCESKVRAIIDMPQPQNIDQVRKFLGMVTYYAKFIPNTSTLTYPLRQLLEKGAKFKWSTKCEEAFKRLKQELCTDRVLTPFNEKLPITVACDASPYGIGAVLSHIINGEEKPIAFISRALTKAEQGYSQLDREALAIIFAVDKFYMYLYARTFTLITDNRPLTRIFHERAKTPAMTSARLLRYASFLQGFSYQIQHRRAEENENVDCLSRAPIRTQETSQHFTEKEIQNIQDQSINEISSYSITAISIAEETNKDPALAKLKNDLQNGSNQSPEFSLQDGIIFKNDRIYIPQSLQQEVLKELHRTHIGVVKMKQLARKYCFWKNIDNDIEKLVRECHNCAMVKKNPPKVVQHHWDEPKYNFQRVHIDYAGPFQNHFFFVLIDAKSKWAEIKVIKEAPTSEKTIMLMENIFATHGLPHVLVSDNATIFQSKTFTDFCNNNGIMQKFIAPGHPATNGLAERHIQTLKAKLKAMQDEKTPIHIKVQQILMRYRATPLSNNKTPAQMYLGRDLRIQLDAMRPHTPEKSKNSNINVRNFSVGDRVQVQWYEKNALRWKFGHVIKKFGRLHYQIKLDNGYALKRHINQLHKTNVQQTRPEPELAKEQQQQKRQIEELQFEPQVDNHYSSIVRPPTTNQQTPTTAEQHVSTTAGQPATATTGQSQLLRRSERVRKPPGYLDDHVRY